jgi:hypothetical protein
MAGMLLVFSAASAGFRNGIQRAVSSAVWKIDKNSSLFFRGAELASCDHGQACSYTF